MSATPRDRGAQLPALTGLRFLAAACIVVFHANHHFGGIVIGAGVAWALAVTLFFMLSGFILAYNYPSLSGLAATRRFWWRGSRVWTLTLGASYAIGRWVEMPARRFLAPKKPAAETANPAARLRETQASARVRRSPRTAPIRATSGRWLRGC